MSKKVEILNAEQINQKIDRIAHQVYEDNFDEKEIIIAGIAERGYLLAERLAVVIEKISTIKTTLVKIKLDKDATALNAKTDVDVQKCEDKVILLVDDVLNTGRTLAYGFGVFLNIPVKKIRTAVLVDRSHKKFPLATDFVGISLSTIAQEHVSVVLDKPGKEVVYIS